MKKIITITTLAIVAISIIGFSFSSANETAKKVSNKTVYSSYNQLADIDNY